MSREPEAIMAQRRQLGAALATFRQAAEWCQVHVLSPDAEWRVPAMPLRGTWDTRHAT